MEENKDVQGRRVKRVEKKPLEPLYNSTERYRHLYTTIENKRAILACLLVPQGTSYSVMHLLEDSEANS